MKKKRLTAFFLPAALFGTVQVHAQYGGYVPASGTAYLPPGSMQEALRDTTTNNGAVTAADSSAIVKFTGSAANSTHVLNGSSGAYSQVGNLVLNNGSGGLVLATATYGLQVLGNLIFAVPASKIVTPRTVSSRTTNNLQLAAGATLVGADASHTVDGYLQKTAGAAFSFPLSQDNVYAPLSVTNIGAGNTLTAAYFSSANPNTTVPSSIASVSNLEYWDVATTGSPSGILSLTLGKDYPNYPAASTVLVGWNTATSAWEQIPTTTPVAVTVGSTITSSAEVTFSSYSAFTIANASAVTTSDATAPIAAQPAKTIDQPVIQAYPNPIKDLVTVSISGSFKDSYTISVYDLNGKLLQSTPATGGSNLQLELGGLANGMYHINVTGKNNSIVKTIKIIKSK